MHDRLLGAWFKLTGRCVVCDRWALLHTPSASRACNDTPIRIVLLDQGRTDTAA
jgi:hypothetical protein